MELRDNSQRAKTILNIFYVLAFVIVALFISNFMQYNLLQSEVFDEAAATSNDIRQQAINLLYLVILITGWVYFIRWFRRAYYNLHMIDSDLEYEESMAAYSWMIPFINFVRPLSIMKEIWEKTQKHANVEKIESSGIVGIWWTFWVIQLVLGNIEFRLPMETLEELQTTTLFALISGVIEFITLMIVIVIIKRVSEFEDALYNAKNEMGIEEHLIDGLKN